MKNVIKKVAATAAIVGVMFSVGGCTTEAKKEENKTIRLGVMSASDSAPILLAEEKGYFKEEGVNLELEIFTNGATKQSSIQAGELDGGMLSMTQILNNANGGLKAKITTTTDGMFPIVLSKNYKEKKDVKVGLMEVSVTNFLADKYLKDYNVTKEFINEMPVRMQMLMADKIDMAVLPEPMASNAQLKGLGKKVYGDPDDFTPNAMVFSDEFIENNPNTVAAFHKAYNRAVEDIINNPDEAKDVLVNKLGLDPKVKELMVLPTYHKTRIPTADYINEVKVWTEKLQGKTLNINYDDIVSKDFVAN
ncbi:ABC transporter substrate-binding protein [Clostridium mediterraneense]|uniref:ABC transporter substrate-binding protein n=1 Tax=Clostridium mediterraneense TaxID=1805472 RepID=UPI000831EA18|nr:ABC transporter substrate-binding protein [Clostridium mediterraneense]